MDKTKIVAGNGRSSASCDTWIYCKHPDFRISLFYLYSQPRTRYNYIMCWYCGLPVTDAEPIGRSARCGQCGKDLRSCKNCRFFFPGSRGDCRETSAEGQPDKERSNFCDWFSLDEKYRSQSAGQPKEREKTESHRAAFNNLFNEK